MIFLVKKDEDLEREVINYKGYKCLIIYMGSYINGYVGLPKGHKYYKMNYDDIPLKVHGGLTFSYFMEKIQNDGLWYIGFDTAHAGDFEFGEFGVRKSNKDRDFVMNEIKKMVDQLVISL